MFKRKHKNSGEMSYDVEKYKEARSTWNSRRPEMDDLSLPTCITSGINADDTLYITWHNTTCTIHLHASSKQENTRTVFKSFLDKQTTTFIRYEVEAAKSPSQRFWHGIVLEGLGSYYITEFIKKAIQINYAEEGVLVEWIDYTTDPIYVLPQTYSKEDFDLLASSLHAFVEEYQRWSEERETWLKEEPQTWQFPLTMENEDYELQI